ncbi:MAG: bifunctional 4-hydroxy-2-oxoglutarate aldolase/2-dehydro-3-deoxy-phosphogluconate aldolase [Clostridia bacterium]|nr:bifunctional 4-hydroxy-2-oxoglutarate aldolase/2-dehydro-3-deoxy-phosphogluconate aldolase [Clostridia bacterium]
MLNRQEIIKDVEKNKIIVILRGFTTEQLINTVDAMEKGGIKLVEVTFDQTGATSDLETAENIRTLCQNFDGKVRVGAGTVMTEEQVELAFNAGAQFIISPDCYEKVIRKTRDLGMVSMPGVLTPSEAANAHRFGADFAKLFPNSEVKLSYLKALAVPLSHIKFLAVGGVNAENMKDYLAAGAKGIGVATAIADKKAISQGDYEEITRRARLFTSQL